MTTGIYSYKGVSLPHDHDDDDNTISVIIKTEPVLLKNLPPQGKGFFTVFTTMFRGRGIYLTSTREDNFGLYTLVCDFFTAVSTVFITPPSQDSIEAAVLSPTVTALDIVVTEGAFLAGALLKLPPGKDPLMFRSSNGRGGEERMRRKDRDLVIHYHENPEFLTPTELRDFILNVQSVSSNRLYIGGFYVLITVPGYKSTDLLLSIISSSLTPLTYVGMILANNIYSLWIFRLEKDKQDTTSARLTRYPIALQQVIKDLTPEFSEITTSYNTELDIMVTPTATLNDLFRMLTPRKYREVFNMLLNFQDKYAAVIERGKANKDQKVQMKILVDILYDLALSAKRC